MLTQVNGYKFNQSTNFSCTKMFFTPCVLCSSRLLQLRTKDHTVQLLIASETGPVSYSHMDHLGPDTDPFLTFHSSLIFTLLREPPKNNELSITILHQPIACLSSGSYSIFSVGINFFSSFASSSGVKLIALILYVRIFSFSAGASSNSTVARRQSGRYIIGILVSGRR